MGQSYNKNKVHIYNWVEKNRDKHNEINRISKRKADERKRVWKQVAEEFRHILL